MINKAKHSNKNLIHALPVEESPENLTSLETNEDCEDKVEKLTLQMKIRSNEISSLHLQQPTK